MATADGGIIATSGGSFDAVFPAGTYAALSGGNHSGSGTAIQQVLTRQPQGDEKQLPVVLYGCQNTTPLILPIGGPTCGNINVIELSTDKPQCLSIGFVQLRNHA